MVEVGSWKNFEDLEECLILDELMLLSESLGKKRKDNFKQLAAAQGVDIPDDDDDELDLGDDDLPPELLEAERELAKKKAEMRNERTTFSSTGSGEGIGYQSVAQDIIDQSVL